MLDAGYGPKGAWGAEMTIFFYAYPWILPVVICIVVVTLISSGAGPMWMSRRRRLRLDLPHVSGNATADGNSAAEQRRGLLMAASTDRNLGSPEKAIALFTDALTIDNCCVEALKGRGLCFIELAEYDSAIQDFHAWVLRAPQSSEAFRHRAMVWEVLGFADMAVSDLRTALSFSKSSAAARVLIDELARLQFGDQKQTGADLENTQSMKPSTPQPNSAGTSSPPEALALPTDELRPDFEIASPNASVDQHPPGSQVGT